MELRTDDLRVVDLADEFGITISETLALCKMFDIPAPYGSSVITPAGATLLRGLARGEIDPESVDNATLAEARGPDYQPAAATDSAPRSDALPSSSNASTTAAGISDAADEADEFASLRGESSESGETDETGETGERGETEYDYGDPADYDSFGVAGLEDFPTAPKGDAQSSSAVATPRPASSRHIDETPTESADASGHAGGAIATLGSSRPVQVDRASERRRSTRRRQDAEEREKKAEYDPSKLRAEYDDIDKYVPKWLKFVALAAIGVFGFLSYQLFFGGSPEVAETGVGQDPIYSAGDCFNADIALWIDTMAPTGCAGEHDGEVFDVFFFAGTADAAYPDPAALTSQARQACRGPFTNYTGESSIASSYRIGVSLPSSIEWTQGDRFAYCSVVSADGTQLVGSTAK